MATPIPSLRLSPKKEIAAGMIALGHSQAETARDPRVEVTKQTMNIWCQDPDFVDRVNELRVDKLKQAEEAIIRSVPAATNELIDIALGNSSDDSKTIATKVKVLLWILDRGMGKKLPVSKKRIDEDDDDEDFDDDEVDSILESAKK